jgi:aspartyl-tRNA(Asn)/glutamyl-tRNA(Gln) amidotransferase subunit C
MKVTEKEVAYVADLANLDLTPDERTRMLRDLNSILDHIDSLNELDTSKIAPMAQVMAGVGTEKGSEQFAYARREDTLIPSLPHEAALQNSPEANKDFFKVPKVIER